MKRLVQAALAAATLLVPSLALACGAFFAHAVEVAPDQKIVVVHRNGVETYVFRPHFCGEAKDFGVILPIPSTLTTNPALASNALFDELDDYTKPQVVEVCEQRGGIGCGAAKAGGDFRQQLDAGNGVNVIDRGRVGQFEYALVQALTVNAFTDWLDTNGFPHGTNTDIWQHYVTRQWYFVAFKVSADTAAPPAGQKLCGDLGPIQLSFATPTPLVPSRVAGVNGVQSRWRVFVVGASEYDGPNSAGYTSSTYFSGAVTQAELAARPALAALARDGDWLSAVDVGFGQTTSDVDLSPRATSMAFRSTKTVTKPCNGCATGGSAIDALGAVGMLALLAALRRVRRTA